MINPVHVYAWQAAIVGNARLEGRPVRALMLEDPWAGSFARSPETFLGFEVDGGFEPSFDRWFERMKARGLLAIRSLRVSDPSIWVLYDPPDSPPRLPELALVFPDRVVWYRYFFPWPGPQAQSAVSQEDGFREVPETRSAAVPSVEDAERELLAATREYVAFVGPQARKDHSSDVFYAAMGQKALELLTDTEASFQTRLAALREADVKEYRRRSKDWWPVQPATRAMRPQIFENAARSLERDDYLRVMEAAGLSWRAVRLACAAQDIWPLNMHNERTSEDMLPPFVQAPGYAAIGKRWADAANAACNAAVNAR
ncbi:hypothetical protein OWM54_07085 [Myxococcus sp. MISCRS1]|jgi:hypothetical protein|uniref:hypothetical protein n=1 Tax=Myxococcus TaxID=32 RepID=UPI001CC0E4AF|nr:MULTISPECIES: hypothetical protein [unclassified Myxococcus]MBZ4400768.1 hypothetical protein [Myxococcus sp. AS-1-15]MBZ4414772.1 hypothetical protein [Myxococcus sp. XM-1-1-1]MCY0996904.1 hypothetical protein [Myxococcus sp. MISCRS1]